MKYEVHAVDRNTSDPIDPFTVIADGESAAMQIIASRRPDILVERLLAMGKEKAAPPRQQKSESSNMTAEVVGGFGLVLVVLAVGLLALIVIRADDAKRLDLLLAALPMAMMTIAGGLVLIGLREIIMQLVAMNRK